MKILFLGYEKDHLNIIDYIKNKTTIIDAVGYDGMNLDNKVHRKELSNICIGDYKIIFLSAHLTREELALFDNYKDEDVLLFQGLKWIDARSLKSDISNNQATDLDKGHQKKL